MIRRVFFCLILFVCCSLKLAAAQSGDSTNLEEVWHRPKSAIRINPVYVMSRFPIIALSYETKFSPSFNLFVEAGVVTNFNGDPSEYINKDFLNKRGLRLKTHLRNYINTKRNPLFIGFGLDYYRFDYDRQKARRISCGRGCDYYRFDEYRIKRQDIRFSLNAGSIIAFGRNAFLEAYTGLTVGAQVFQNFGRLADEDTSDEFQLSAEREEGSYSVVRPKYGLRLGYKFR